MAPTILIVGATGNTGKSVVETLPGLLKNTKFASHRILCLTRSKDGSGAKQIAKYPGVEVQEQFWPEITEDWLSERQVERAFIASHNGPTQFAEEGQFLNNCLRAGVKYVVRISTTSCNVSPDYPAFYPRTHWALENMISQPEYKNMHWTSLRPNLFAEMAVGQAAQFIKDFRKTGKQPGTLSTLIDENKLSGVIDPHDVGCLAAHLLAQEDTSAHNQKRLVLSGPSDICGKQVTKWVEGYIGEPVKDVKYLDFTVVEKWAETTNTPNIIMEIAKAGPFAFSGAAKADTTSPEVRELYPPRIEMEAVLKGMVEN